MLEMLDSRRYETFVSRFRRTLSARHEARSGAAIAAGACPRSGSDRTSLPIRPQGRRQDSSPTRRRPSTTGSGSAASASVTRWSSSGRCTPARRGRSSNDSSSLQDVLGLHQDADIAIDRLRRLSISHGSVLDPGTVFAMGEIAERQRRSMIEQRAHFPRAYAGMSGKRWRALQQAARRQASRAGSPASATPDDREPLTS